MTTSALDSVISPKTRWMIVGLLSASITTFYWIYLPLYAGGVISPTVDYRPPGTSAIAFLIKGPPQTDLPGAACPTP
jgi:hypothetical protein